MSTATEPTTTQARLHTIGAVCERLRGEFPDISISKIRYLEDQGLLRPRRTRGGYRLFSEGDVERLETILRLQRDEFLPLRVIKDALDAPGSRQPQATSSGAPRRERRARAGRVLRARGDRGGLRPQARGVRPGHAADRVRRADLPRERRRDRGRLWSPCTPRSRRTAPACLPDGGRPPVGAARAARRQRAPLPRPERDDAPPSRTSRRSRASPRSSPSIFSSATSGRPPSDDDRRAEGTGARRPGLPGGGNRLQGPDAVDRQRRGVPVDHRAPRRVGAAPQSRHHPRCRGAWLHLRRRAGVRARLRVRPGAEARQAPLGEGAGDVRARVRHRLARGPRRRDRPRRPRDRPRRRARDRAGPPTRRSSSSNGSAARSSARSSSSS